MEIKISELRKIIKEEIGKVLEVVGSKPPFDINKSEDVNVVLGSLSGKLKKFPTFEAALEEVYKTYGVDVPENKTAWVEAWKEKWDSWKPEDVFAKGPGQSIRGGGPEHVGRGDVKMSGQPGIGIGIASRREGPGRR